MEAAILNGSGPATRRIVTAVLDVWPDHEKFIRHSFSDPSRELANTREIVSDLLLRLAADHQRPIVEWAQD